MDLGSCPSEVVDRAIQSRELKRSIGRLKLKDFVLKVAGKEEFLLEEKSLSCYQVCVCLSVYRVIGVVCSVQGSLGVFV